MDNQQIEIIHEGDHYVGYIDGEFFCSGDTPGEVAREIDDFIYSYFDD